MRAEQQEKQPSEREKQGHQDLAAAIGRRVLHALGQPGDLLVVQVRPLWEGHYRANVLVGTGSACARVAHSYFLVADGEGNILTAAPTIRKQY